ncbi:unnamed protein product [Diplocarpon coronariae]
MRCPRDRASPGLPQVSPRSPPGLPQVFPSPVQPPPHPPPRMSSVRRSPQGQNSCRLQRFALPAEPLPLAPLPLPPPRRPESLASGTWHLAPGTWHLARARPPPPFQELDSGRVLRRRHCRAFVFARSICGAGHDARSGESAFSPGCSPRRPEGRRGKAGPAECLRKSRPRLLGCSALRVSRGEAGCDADVSPLVGRTRSIATRRVGSMWHGTCCCACWCPRAC